jgi:hypothetical protein
MKTTLDRFNGTYRRANWCEMQLLDLSNWTPAFVPNLRPLGHAATANDVNAGRAVFHLEGKGKLAEIKLPAVAVLNRGGKKDRPQRGLIVQAEVESNGDVTYVVVTREDIRPVPGHEVAAIKSFAELEKEEKDAAKKEVGKKD